MIGGVHESHLTTFVATCELHASCSIHANAAIQLSNILKIVHSTVVRFRSFLRLPISRQQEHSFSRVR